MQAKQLEELEAKLKVAVKTDVPEPKSTGITDTSKQTLVQPIQVEDEKTGLKIGWDNELHALSSFSFFYFICCIFFSIVSLVNYIKFIKYIFSFVFFLFEKT